VIPPPQLERIELEARRDLIEQALEAERSLDETGSPKGGVRRRVQLRAVLHGAHVFACVEHLHRASSRARESVRTDGHHELSLECRQRPVRASASA
jgi:hypothetical protein